MHLDINKTILNETPEKLQCRNELIFKYMIFNFAAWQVTFLMIDFSLETTWSIYCCAAVSRTVGWMLAAPCDGRYNTC